MYTPYLLLAYAAALFMVLLGFAVVRQSVPNLRGITSLRRFLLCALCALVLLGLRSRAPMLLTIVVPNCLLCAGTAFLYLAITEILNAPPRLLAWVVGCCLIAAPALAWFTYVQNRELVRLEIHCGVLVAILTISCATLFGERRSALQRPARACCWLLAASIVLDAGWGAYGLLHRPAPVFLHLDPVNAAISYVVMILSLANVMALGWLSFCVHREDLKMEAQTDALTGLTNRGAFEQLLREEIARRIPEKLCLILVDVDYFKQVNDSHGHLVGDDILRRVGATLRMGIRPVDILARYGGEEFVVLVRGAEPEEGQEIAERLRASIEALDDLPHGVNLTASFGVAATRRTESAGALLHRADEALYRSKREGRNRVRVDEGLVTIGD